MPGCQRRFGKEDRYETGSEKFGKDQPPYCFVPAFLGLALAQDRGAGQQRRIGGDYVDDRVQLLEYHFKDTDETLPYAVFVSTKVTKDKKAPLVLALHGFSGNHGTFMRTQCVDEAEKNGYILVGAMGYSPSGSFGMPMGARGGAAGRGGPGGRAAAPGPTDGQPGRGMFMGPRNGPGGTKETDPAKIAELSEKDAMNVLEIARKGFNVDDNRIYLMGILSVAAARCIWVRSTRRFGSESSD